ncbi:MAG TPA: hypothetical protein VKZ61_13300 [Thermomicrobiales bacterium]|jgi:hypothetical protein|nr:hypothetical protein [Thermomicrobiales bacterium]
MINAAAAFPEYWDSGRPDRFDIAGEPMEPEDVMPYRIKTKRDNTGLLLPLSISLGGSFV